MRAQEEGQEGLLKARRAVLVGTARNCAPSLEGALANISRFASQYGSTAYIFVVGDTTDQTATTLRHWMSDGGREGRVIDQGDLQDIEPRRTVRIAAARNICMNEVRRRNYRDYDHIVVCDLDEVLAAPISEMEFARAAKWLTVIRLERVCLPTRDPSTSIFGLYDIKYGALATAGTPSGIGRLGSRLKQRNTGTSLKRQVGFHLTVGPIKVDLAFGGLAIDKLSVTTAAAYVGLDADDESRPSTLRSMLRLIVKAVSCSFSCDW